MHPVLKFQLQVLRAWKLGQANAEKMVKLYEGFVRSSQLDEHQSEWLRLQLAQHRAEVKMYKDLIANALKKK